MPNRPRAGGHRGAAAARAGRTESGAADAVAEILRRYADRGVFRGFSARKRQGDSSEFRFLWLTGRPMTLVYEPETGLTFKNVLPGVRAGSPLLADVQALVDERTGRTLPSHRRIDMRRARVACSLRRGSVSLTLSPRGQGLEYAVQKGLNLVNDLFILLRSTYPDYLSEHFDVSPE